MSARRFHRLLGTIAAGSPPGSRVCFRNLAALRSLPPVTGPPTARPRLRSLPDLAAALDREDTSVFYRFGVAEIS